MEERSETRKSNPNPTSGASEKKAKGKNNQFEFCKVCKLNHNQGRRHNYFPNHVKSLSSFLSRFQTKLSDVRFFLKNPSLLRPDLASQNRFWCVFCDSDVTEIGSSFACDSAINHLASADHLKNVKSFMWKYGGGMDRVDCFLVSEADLMKYDKKCKLLKSDGASEQSCGPLKIGPLNDIHNELSFEYIDNFDNSNINSHTSSITNGVLPLQNHTNEKYQVSHSELSRVAAIGTSALNDKLLFTSLQLDSNTLCSSGITGFVENFRGSSCLPQGYHPSGVVKMNQVYADRRTANGESSSAGLPMLTQISPKVRDEVAGNVHSGAPPPWFETANGIQFDTSLRPGQGMDNIVSPHIKTGKSKLNPKRVGAAWAERRKIEMEMEKRGELPANKFDADWLPNFGRVWQSGSRKESRKEFEVEKKPVKDENKSETLVPLQPYISKRMRREAYE